MEQGKQSNSYGTADYFQLGAQVGYKGQYLNAAYGADGFGETDVLYLDYTGGFDLSDSLFLGINAAYSNSEDADAGYQGAALYIENTFSDSFALGLRPEFFQTNGASEETVTALTLAASSSLTDNLKVITEVRYDSSDDMDLVGGKDTVNGIDHRCSILFLRNIYFNSKQKQLC